MQTSVNDAIHQLALKHNLGESSINQLVTGLLNSGGGQVQFNIPEFGGMGQWMNGMVMAGSLFDHALKARVDNVCSDIAAQVRAGTLRHDAPPVSSNRAGEVSIRFSRGNTWWPGNLGVPAATGSQNELRYAWFPAMRRLAVDLGGRVWVYDTADHRIGGVSQQQSPHGMTLTFTSQHGIIDLASLPVVSKE